MLRLSFLSGNLVITMTQEAKCVFKTHHKRILSINHSYNLCGDKNIISILLNLLFFVIILRRCNLIIGFLFFIDTNPTFYELSSKVEVDWLYVAMPSLTLYTFTSEYLKDILNKGSQTYLDSLCNMLGMVEVHAKSRNEVDNCFKWVDVYSPF